MKTYMPVLCPVFPVFPCCLPLIALMRYVNYWMLCYELINCVSLYYWLWFYWGKKKLMYV